MHAGAAPAWVVAALELANSMCMAMTGASMLGLQQEPLSRTALLLRTWRCPAALLLALAWCQPMWAVLQVRPQPSSDSQQHHFRGKQCIMV